MARPRDTERSRREQAFRAALIHHQGDVEKAQAAAGIAWSHVGRLLNRPDWLALLTALRNLPTAVAA